MAAGWPAMDVDMSITIREATLTETTELSALAVRSKGHWGYSTEFLDACREELSVDPAKLATRRYECHVAVDGATILGFYALEELSMTAFELDALFVDPSAIGKGVGRELLQHAILRLAARGAERLVIQGDPHAADFYEAAGGRLVGTRESGSIPGRQLPMYEIDITMAQARLDIGPAGS